MPAPKELKNPVSKHMKQFTMARLGLSTLPAQVEAEIDKKASQIADRMWDIDVSKEGFREAKDILQKTNVQTMITSRMKDALNGMKSVSQSPDLKSILKENADMLRAKYNALMTAGFSAGEAFELVKVELGARKSR